MLRGASVHARALPRLSAVSRMVCSASSPTVWCNPSLNYQLPPPAGKRTGRYIGEAVDKGDTVDENDPRQVDMLNGRQLPKAATLETTGFTLAKHDTAVTDFRDDAEVTSTYYEEMIALVKQASGADRVLIFDHTVRSSQSTSLNALEKGATAAAVPRVHCDYTADSAPRRLAQLASDGIYSRLRGRNLTVEEVQALSSNRFAFINVWRSIDKASPVKRMPLAVCDTTTVCSKSDLFLYELIYKDRIGENYSLKHSDRHRWYYYPDQEADEALVFKVFDQDYDGPRFVFHTAFEDPLTQKDDPARESIEIRAIAFYDVDSKEPEC